MGWFVGFCRNGYNSNHHKNIYRWCDDAPETFGHVFNDCVDLQIQLFRSKLQTTPSQQPPFAQTVLQRSSFTHQLSDFWEQHEEAYRLSSYASSWFD